LELDVEFALGLDFEHAAKRSKAAAVTNRVVAEKVLCETLGRSRGAGKDMFIDGFVTIVPVILIGEGRGTQSEIAVIAAIARDRKARKRPRDT
jgi:hypothetical protein